MEALGRERGGILEPTVSWHGVRRQKQRTQRARPNPRRERWRTEKQQEPSARCKYTCTSRVQLRCRQALVGTLSKSLHDLPAHALHLGALDFVAGRAGESVEENNPGRAQPEGNQGDGKSIDLAHTALFEVVLTVRAAAEAQSPIADAAPGLLTLALLAGQLTALPITELLLPSADGVELLCASAGARNKPRLKPKATSNLDFTRSRQHRMH